MILARIETIFKTSRAVSCNYQTEISVSVADPISDGFGDIEFCPFSFEIHFDLINGGRFAIYSHFVSTRATPVHTAGGDVPRSFTRIPPP